ncbi:MAG: hypothetical protein L0Z53_06045 [Acidobacteriales bacterium]|nr:hypothetical protein [Terriglobales bacterium]
MVLKDTLSLLGAVVTVGTVGMAIGVFDERLRTAVLAIEAMAERVDSLDVMQAEIRGLNKRLNRLEYGQEELVSAFSPAADRIARR